MKQVDVDNMLASLNDDFFKKMQDQMIEIEPDIEPDPSIDKIKALLGEVPAQIEYLKTRANEVRKKIQDLKLMVKAKRSVLEIEKSKIRQQALEQYQTELKGFLIESKTLFNDVRDEKKKLPTSVIQEMIRVIKPEKPTQNNLDDLANLKTETIQMELFGIEKKINEYEALYGVLSTMAEKYENKNLAVRAHKGLLEAEMRNHIN